MYSASSPPRLDDSADTTQALLSILGVDVPPQLLNSIPYIITIVVVAAASATVHTGRCGETIAFASVPVHVGRPT